MYTGPGLPPSINPAWQLTQTRPATHAIAPSAIAPAAPAQPNPLPPLPHTRMFGSTHVTFKSHSRDWGPNGRESGTSAESGTWEPMQTSMMPG
jgi:hypothetical protein